MVVGGVLRPQGVGVAQGGFDYAKRKVKVERKKDRGWVKEQDKYL